MKGKIFLLFTLIAFIGVLVNSLSSMPTAETHGKDAYIEKVQYREEVNVNERDSWNFTVHNANLSADSQGRAWFFFKFYLGDQIFWDEYNGTSYKTWQCNKTKTTTRLYQIPRWTSLMPNWSPTVPATSERAVFKIELYWYREGTAIFQDSVYLSVAYTSVIRIMHPMALSYLVTYSFLSLFLLFYLSPTLRKLVAGE